MQGKKEYWEKLFLSFQLSQKVPLTNFYRRLKDTLDLLINFRSMKRVNTHGLLQADKHVLMAFFGLYCWHVRTANVLNLEGWAAMDLNHPIKLALILKGPEAIFVGLAVINLLTF